MRILIIEDELIIANDIKMILEKNKHTVVAMADEYHIAINLFNKFNPELIISDVYIKGSKSGLETVKKLLELRKINIIFITAYSTLQLIEEISELHDVTFITKPFTESQIMAAIQMIECRIKRKYKRFILSKREEEVLNYLLAGKSVIETAHLINLSEETVKTHKKNIFIKCNVNSTSKLISQFLN
jgi:DNA-binding NarL/FixJ family response regulator